MMRYVCARRLALAPILAVVADAGRRIIDKLAELSQPSRLEVHYRASENIGIIREADIRAAAEAEEGSSR
jgi:hypothetical protein